jgi:predicted MFS family arabinose efflux permease
LSRIPDSSGSTAIVVLVGSLTGSYSVAGLAAGAFGVGTAVSAPLAGRATDRLGQRRVLPVLAAGFAGALIVLLLSSASVRRAVPAAAATEAFAWTFAVITVGMAAGSATGGMIIQTASTAAAFACAGALSLAGALFGALRLAWRSSLSTPAVSSGRAPKPLSRSG